MKSALRILVALSLSACAPAGKVPEGIGSAGVYLALGDGNSVRVTVTVTGSGMEEMQFDLAVTESGAWAELTVPAGPDRTFSATVVQQDGTICAGSSSADVIEGAAVEVDIVLNCSAPGSALGHVAIDGELNYAPSIQWVVVTRTTVLPGETISLYLGAVDPEDEELVLIWESDDGVVGYEDGTWTWTAPETAGTFTLTGTATDPYGAEDNTTHEITVLEQGSL